MPPPAPAAAPSSPAISAPGRTHVFDNGPFVGVFLSPPAAPAPSPPAPSGVHTLAPLPLPLPLPAPIIPRPPRPRCIAAII
eukprot:30566-Pelagococcus_subviridis.AAC.11